MSNDSVEQAKQRLARFEEKQACLAQAISQHQTNDNKSLFWIICLLIYGLVGGGILRYFTPPPTWMIAVYSIGLLLLFVLVLRAAFIWSRGMDNVERIADQDP